MRSKVVRTLALALLLGGIGIVMGQAPKNPPREEEQETAKKPPKRKVIVAEKEEEIPKRVNPKEQPKKSKLEEMQPKKSKLEEMLTEALKNNPDIRVAAAKLAEADAELNRTRLQVTQKVVMLYHAIETQKKLVELDETKYKRYQELLQGRSITEKLADEKQQELALAKAKLAELEAQVPALLGKTPPSEYEWTFQEAKLTRQESIRSSIQTRRAVIEEAEREKVFKATGPMAERLRKALQTSVKVDYKFKTLDAILDDLKKRVPGLSFRNVFNLITAREQMTMRFDEALPVSAILQALADETGCSFFVREYGILAIHRPSAPPGAMTVEEFLRQKPAQPATPAGAASNDGMMWRPPENIEGTVKTISSGGWLGIEFKTVDGLLSGHTLYVYRPSDGESKPKYLGMVRIVNVRGKPDQFGQYTDAQPVGRFKESPKVGDKVTSHAPEK